MNRGTKVWEIRKLGPGNTDMEIRVPGWGQFVSDKRVEQAPGWFKVYASYKDGGIYPC